MIRLCPKCHSERPAAELICEGVHNDMPCGWDLAGVDLTLPGEVDPRPAPGAPAESARRVCMNGHPMEPGDLLCTVCDADPLEPDTQSPEPVAQETAAEPDHVEHEPRLRVIGDWRLVVPVQNRDKSIEQFRAEHVTSEQAALLTLYQPRAEPDTAVYDTLRRLSREHVPEILETGRWQEQAYEVSEALTEGTLADLGIVMEDMPTIRHIVQELGTALHSFTEVGLRHRDLRPEHLFVRSRTPLDLVITGFGSARLSDADLDIVSPLEITAYSAPETIAGGVAAASDWWSLGMILLEQITRGECFRGINPSAFIIHVLANGAPIPDDIEPSLHTLLRGLLARDRMQRWQWAEVKAWLAGENVSAPTIGTLSPEGEPGAAITLAGKPYFKATRFALAAAETAHWEEAKSLLLRGDVLTWAQDISLDSRSLSILRNLLQLAELDEDFRMMLALKTLNRDMPLIHRGIIVTPAWLLEFPLEGYSLITGQVPDLLFHLESDHWLIRLKTRAAEVRARIKEMEIDADEEALKIHLLSTSRARLWAIWEARRQHFPEASHEGLLSLMERRLISEEDLIVLLSAHLSLYRAMADLLTEAADTARKLDLIAFDATQAEKWLAMPRLDLYRAVDERIGGFAACGNTTIDGWADRFRLERRMPLTHAVVLLSFPEEQWRQPPKQQYVSQIVDFFRKKVVTSVLRGPLVRMTIGRTTPRIDVAELGTPLRPAVALLEHLVKRNEKTLSLDPNAFTAQPQVEDRLQSLCRQATMYKRDTGIDGLYLGFPFLVVKEGRGNIKPRVAPLLLWPIKILAEVGTRGQYAIAFDREREEVRLNPALDGIIGQEAAKRWHAAADELLKHSSLKVADVMDGLGILATPKMRELQRLPASGLEVPDYQSELHCYAVLFNATFLGQAIAEDLRSLKEKNPVGTGLETLLRVTDMSAPVPAPKPREIDRYFVVESDPSQEAAVLQSRQAPGQLIEGPPGTGKSQTIVNMVADAIGRQKSLLIVCQKHAALEVVRKRIVAEGLGHRLVMINDVNKDRDAIIRSVREQVEDLQKQTRNQVGTWRRQREQIAARIEILEGELDRHNESLHQVDELHGLTYRGVIAELIELEQGSAPLELPALRSHLRETSTATLARIEENCASLARFWLPAKFEDSPLIALQLFSHDKATIDTVAHALFAFYECEKNRIAVFIEHPSRFDFSNPDPYRGWLDTHGDTFLLLDETRRQNLARWLFLFRPAAKKYSRGKELIDALGALQVQLKQCDNDAHDEHWFPLFTKLSTEEIDSWCLLAKQVTAPAHWICAINPARIARRKKLTHFMTEHADTATPPRMRALIAAAKLEKAIRPLRTALGDILQEIKMPELEKLSLQQLKTTTSQLLAGLSEAMELAGRLASAPHIEVVDETAIAATKDAFLNLYSQYNAAFKRNDARARSQASLKALAPWVEPNWFEQMTRSILRNDLDITPIQRILQSVDTLSAYQYFRARAAHLPAEAMQVFTILRTKETMLEQIPAPQLENDIRRLIKREALLSWKQRFEQLNPTLLLEREFIESKIENLATVDREMRELNRKLLIDGVDVSALGSAKAWDDITKLSGKRARRLREFLELGAPVGLFKVRPIWLMNPDVASRLLPLQAGMFDTVIYDEASQMPVEYALPTLYRGRCVVVSGDEKQMPPSAFFTGKLESDEPGGEDGELLDEIATEEERAAYDENWNRREIKDCPDLLQLARGVLPTTTLQIHYRSEYRELIAFSNAAFYGNSLNVPIRHSDDKVLRDKPIEVVRVDGVYENQTNRAEADAIVGLLAELWRAPFEQRPSIGVVTFNLKQAELIEAALETYAETDDAFRNAYRQELARHKDGEDMGIFVKNVDNVQGDERDMVLFSTTFGRNSQGTFKRYFGILGQRGGERRLNVAVTRARKKIVLVTSLPIADISDMLNTQRSPETPRDYLQGYLEYARITSEGQFQDSQKHLQRMLISRTGRSTGEDVLQDGFSDSVARFIEAEGWTVIRPRESDLFSFDFAIVDPETGLYALGVECDGPSHPLLANARARDIWRPQLLKRALPHMHRVSCHAWYHAAWEERERLKAAIVAALKKGVAA